MTTAEDEILLQKIAVQNDGQALKTLFDTYYPRLFHFALSLLHNRPVAEEIVEDVFIRLWETRATLPAINNLSAYLLTAARNGILNHQRLKKNQAYLNIEDAQVEIIAEVRNPEERLISAQALQQIDASIASLPPQCRLIFQLVKEHGLKYREAAELLHLSVKTVEAQMGLALRKISESLLETGVTAQASRSRKK